MPGDYANMRQNRTVPIAAPEGVADARLTISAAQPEPWASITIMLRPTVRARRQMLHTLAALGLQYSAHDTGGAWHVCVRGPHRLLERLERRPGIISIVYAKRHTFGERNPYSLPAE